VECEAFVEVNDEKATVIVKFDECTRLELS
jgi:hypothetical protein